MRQANLNFSTELHMESLNCDIPCYHDYGYRAYVYIIGNNGGHPDYETKVLHIKIREKGCMT